MGASPRTGSFTARDIPPMGKVEIDEEEMPQGMANPLLRTVLMRLQYAVGFGSWEIRIICLGALAKIAFLSSFEVKLHLYSFFQTISKDNGVGLAAEVMPIYQTLHKIFLAFSDYVTTGANLSTVKKKEINDEIKRYCEIPPHFHPLGFSSGYGQKKSKSRDTEESKKSFVSKKK